MLTPRDVGGQIASEKSNGKVVVLKSAKTTMDSSLGAKPTVTDVCTLPLMPQESKALMTGKAIYAEGDILNLPLAFRSVVSLNGR